MPEKNGKLDMGLIRELAAILREADLGEIEIQQGDLRIKVVKPETRAIHVAAAPVHAAPAAHAPPRRLICHDVQHAIDQASRATFGPPCSTYASRVMLCEHELPRGGGKNPLWRSHDQ